MTSPAITQMISSQMPRWLSGRLEREPPMPAVTMRTRAGTKSLLTWVRVDQTTRSPSFNRLGLIATCGSCHVGAHVHDVSGAHRPARHDEPAVPVDVLGQPPQQAAVGQVHLDVPAR